MYRFAIALLVVVIPPALQAAYAEIPVRGVYTPIQLFNGKDLSEFYTFIKDRGRDSDPKQVFTVRNGMIVVSGEEWGCLTTHESFSRYHLVCEFRWGPKAWGEREKATRDSGILVHSQGEDGSYSGTWITSIECQLIEGGSGDLLVVAKETEGLSIQSLFQQGMPEGQKYYHPQGQPITMKTGRLNWWGRDPKWTDTINYRGPDDVENWPGEWNRLECIVDGPNIRVLLNGAMVNACTHATPSEGKIQIQSEGAELHIRRLELHPLWAPPAGMKRSTLTSEAYTDRQGNAHPLKNPEDWKLFRERMRWNMGKISGTIAPPAELALNAIEMGEEKDMGTFIIRRIAYPVDGLEDLVPAQLLIPKGLHDRTAAVVALHQTTPSGKNEPSGIDGDPELAYAKELAERGYVVIAPDYVTFGEYNPDWLGMGYVSGTAKGVRNHMAAISVLQELPIVDPDRIGCIGHSLGGHNALFLALFDERIKVVASSCGFDSVATYYDGDLTGWSQDRYMPRVAWVYGKDAKRMPIDYTEILAAIAPRPIYINAPLHDDNFDVTGVDYCIDFARVAFEAQGAGEKLLVEHPDAKHSFPLAQREAAYALFDKVLRPVRP